MALNEKHHAALEHLLAGKTVAETADLIGSRRETVWRWTKKREFSNIIEAHKQAHLEALSDKMGAMADSAVGVLESIMLDDEAKDADRIRAAKEILDRAAPAKGIGTPVKIEAEVHQWMNGGGVLDVD